MFRPFVKGASIAMSPRGRKVIALAVAAARSDEARRIAAGTRRLATSPETRKIAADVARAAARAGKTVVGPENRDRVRAAARYLAEHRP